MTKKDNMKLWDSVSVTDPNITRKVNVRGGFTAISPQSQLKTATEMWGAYGDTWGLTDLQWEYIKDAVYKENKMIGEAIVELTLTAQFYYPGGDFPLSSDMRYSAGQETRKKLITDLRSKCLSTLGFNSDVFEGKFDDNRYVEEARIIARQKEVIGRATDAIGTAKTEDELTTIRKYLEKIDLPASDAKKLGEQMDERLQVI